jgi:hypothetical protein
MAILGNGSVTTVHPPLAKGASKRGKPRKRPKQKRPGYGRRERPKGDNINKKWHD